MLCTALEQSNQHNINRKEPTGTSTLEQDLRLLLMPIRLRLFVFRNQFLSKTVISPGSRDVNGKPTVIGRALDCSG